MCLTQTMRGMLTLTMAMTITTIRRVVTMCGACVRQIMVKIMFSFENIYKAYKDCSKHKRNNSNALNFEINLIKII